MPNTPVIQRLLTQFGLATLLDRLVETGDDPGGLAKPLQLGDGDPGGLGYLLVGGLAAQLGGQAAFGGPRLPLTLGKVHGDPDGPRLGLDRPSDGLTDPPRGVGGKLEPSAPVELVDGPHQPDDALLDEVAQRHLALVPLGDRDHQAQVAVDEVAGRLFACPQVSLQLPSLGHGDCGAGQLLAGPPPDFDGLLRAALVAFNHLNAKKRDMDGPPDL